MTDQTIKQYIHQALFEWDKERIKDRFIPRGIDLTMTSTAYVLGRCYEIINYYDINGTPTLSDFIYDIIQNSNPPQVSLYLVGFVYLLTAIHRPPHEDISQIDKLKDKKYTKSKLFPLYHILKNPGYVLTERIDRSFYRLHNDISEQILKNRIQNECPLSENITSDLLHHQ